MGISVVTRSLVGVSALCLLASLTACGTETTNPAAPALKAGSSEALTLSDVDYSNKNYWLRFAEDNNHDVDIFVVYPTVTRTENEADLPFVRIDNPLMRETASAWLERMDDIIKPVGDVYAPLYGQLNGAMLSQFSSAEFASYTYANPRDDIFAAFDYYLTEINRGERPFILFGHSQGGSLVTELATIFLGNEKYYQYNKDHIVTYALGYSVTQSRIDENPNLKFSQSPDDTGVIVSWNTIAPSEIASGTYADFGPILPDALVTNPISWTTDETLRHAADNLASKIAQPDGTYQRVEHYANALVDMEHHVLVTTTVPEADYSSNVTTTGKFHGSDIMFYYDSIAQNLKTRISAFK